MIPGAGLPRRARVPRSARRRARAAPGPAVVRHGRTGPGGSGIAGATRPPGRWPRCDIMRPADLPSGHGRRMPGRPDRWIAGGRRTTCAGTEADQRARPHPWSPSKGGPRHGRTRSARSDRRVRRSHDECIGRVRGRTAGDHQALPGRRRQPRHRAAGPARRGARDRRGERRRQVDADEDPLRHVPPRRGDDPARRPGGAAQEPVRRHRGRHRHGPPALHAGRQLHRPGEHRPGQ